MSRPQIIMSVPLAAGGNAAVNTDHIDYIAPTHPGRGRNVHHEANVWMTSGAVIESSEDVEALVNLWAEGRRRADGVAP